MIESSENHPIVWIVEDHDVLRKNLKRLCSASRKLNCSDTFANAEAMLLVLRKTSQDELPNVILMDVGLPGRSGLEAIDDVIKVAPDCRVVILTVFEDDKKISAAISAGACGYLIKTARPDEIVAAIHEAAQGGSPMSPIIAASVVKLLANLTKVTSPVSLSPREREMLAFIVEGLTAKEIADRLGVSVHTIDTHTRHLFKKINVRSRAAAVARAIRERMI
ncbi:MAG: response regulator transcription factor [Akkermansiaceae bacterium]|nr:response regulator transcription factor [Akkermansiaceae bacterium]MBJ7394512.1 response regulator transcription factor [Akkermansiaceae bacterium]MBJ7422912.1 response regulator transcription factor [Akkermansiaceae bacterium]